MDKEKTEVWDVPTSEGNTQYVIKGYNSDEEEEEEKRPTESFKKKKKESSHSEVQNEKKKKKKKKEKKKKNKKRENRCVLANAIFFLCGVLLCGALFYFEIFPVTQISTNLRVKLGKNKTQVLLFSPNSTPLYPELHSILSSYLERTRRIHILCMHQLDLPQETVIYRACTLMNRETGYAYHMLNPVILKALGSELLVEYNGVQKHTRECVEASWGDFSWNFTGRFCGHSAIALQLAVEEF